MTKTTSLNILKVLHDDLETRLKTYRKAIVHPGSKGTACETAWIKALKEILPRRYEVSSGFAVDHKCSISHQLDVIVHDTRYSAMLLQRDNLTYVPVESVYAAFEVKQTIDGDLVKYAAEKIESLRKLKRTSSKVLQIDGKKKAKKPMPILGGLLALDNDYKRNSELIKRVQEFKNAKALDIVFSLKDGLIVRNQFTAGTTLLDFLFILFSELQSMGNPPALDYLKYLSGMRS